jgi:hypothetical protein
LLRYLENLMRNFRAARTERHPAPAKVWQAMLAIPRGQTRSYGELAAELKSCAQAVGPPPAAQTRSPSSFPATAWWARPAWAALPPHER